MEQPEVGDVDGGLNLRPADEDKLVEKMNPCRGKNMSECFGTIEAEIDKTESLLREANKTLLLAANGDDEASDVTNAASPKKGPTSSGSLPTAAGSSPTPPSTASVTRASSRRRRSPSTPPNTKPRVDVVENGGGKDDEISDILAQTAAAADDLPIEKKSTELQRGLDMAADPMKLGASLKVSKLRFSRNLPYFPRILEVSRIFTIRNLW